MRSWFVVIFVYIAIFAVAATLWMMNGLWFSLPVNPGLILLLLAVFYGILSIRIVGPQELGAVILLGKPAYEVESGPCFVPWIVSRLVKETALTVEIELPDEPENVQKADQDHIAPGKVAPLRITHADGPSAYYGDNGEKPEDIAAEKKKFDEDPIHRRITVEHQLIIRFRIKKEPGNFIQFLTTIGSMQEAIRQLEDEAVTAAQTELARRTPAQMFAYMGNINRAILRQLKILTGELKSLDEAGKIPNAGFDNPWGIEVINAQIKQPDLGQDINKSMTLRAAAINTKLAKFEEAEGARRVLRETGIGQSEADSAIGLVAATVREAMLKAEAEGDKAKLKLMDSTNGVRILELEAVSKLLEKGGVTVVSGGGGDIVGALIGYKKILENTGTPPVASRP